MASLQHLHAQSADYANAADRADIVETLAAAWSRQGAARTAKDAKDEDALGGARSALGEVESPDTGQKQMNLALAQDTINVLTMLKSKTAGNLSDDEQKLIDGLLLEVRTKFLTASGTYRRR